MAENGLAYSQFKQPAEQQQSKKPLTEHSYGLREGLRHCLSNMCQKITQYPNRDPGDFEFGWVGAGKREHQSQLLFSQP